MHYNANPCYRMIRSFSLLPSPFVVNIYAISIILRLYIESILLNCLEFKYQYFELISSRCLRFLGFYRYRLGGNVYRFPGDLDNRPEPGRADIEAGAAFDALILVDDMHHSLTADDSHGRAFPGTDAAALALVRQDIKGN